MSAPVTEAFIIIFLVFVTLLNQAIRPVQSHRSRKIIAIFSNSYCLVSVNARLSHVWWSTYTWVERRQGLKFWR